MLSWPVEQLDSSETTEWVAAWSWYNKKPVRTRGGRLSPTTVISCFKGRAKAFWAVVEFGEPHAELQSMNQAARLLRIQISPFATPITLEGRKCRICFVNWRVVLLSPPVRPDDVVLADFLSDAKSMTANLAGYELTGWCMLTTREIYKRFWAIVIFDRLAIQKDKLKRVVNIRIVISSIDDV